MRHCVEFTPSDIWYLYPNKKFCERKLSIGFCPQCSTPAVELKQFTKDGICCFDKKNGIDADELCFSFCDEIDYKRSIFSLLTE